MIAAQEKLFPYHLVQIVIPHPDSLPIVISHFYIGVVHSLDDYRFSKLKEVSIGKIDLERWVQDGDHLCAFLTSCVQKEEEVKSEKRKCIELYRDVKGQLQSQKTKSIIGVLTRHAMLTLGSEQLLGLMREGITSEIKDCNNRLERKVKPLADVARNFATTLKAFQEELRKTDLRQDTNQ